MFRLFVVCAVEVEQDRKIQKSISPMFKNTFWTWAPRISEAHTKGGII